MPRRATLCKAVHGNECLNLGQIRSAALKEKQAMSENASLEHFVWLQKWENIHADLTKGTVHKTSWEIHKQMRWPKEDCAVTRQLFQWPIYWEQKNPSSVLIHQHLEKINNYCILQQQYPLLLRSWIAKDEAQLWPSQMPNAGTATKNTYIALTTIWLPVENFEVCWFLYTTESDLGLVMMLI